jgi:hypothetical protein
MANIKRLNKITRNTTQKFWLSNTNTKQNGGELRSSGRVNNACSASGTRHFALVKNIGKEGGNVTTTNETYLVICEG